MIEEVVDHAEVGADVRQSVEWTAEVLGEPVGAERAKLAFDTFVDPAAIDQHFDQWRDALAGCGGPATRLWMSAEWGRMRARHHRSGSGPKRE